MRNRTEPLRKFHPFLHIMHNACVEKARATRMRMECLPADKRKGVSAMKAITHDVINGAIDKGADLLFDFVLPQSRARERRVEGRGERRKRARTGTQLRR